MSCTSKFSSHMKMTSNFFIIIINEFFTYPTRVRRLKLFFFFTYDQIFVKMFSDFLFTVSILFKNCFNKLTSSIFTSKNNNWFTEFIINTNKFVSKTTTNVILISFLSKKLHNFQLFQNYTENQHKL